MTHWWGRLFRRNQMEEQLDKEVRFHLGQHTADLVAGGRDAGEARREAWMALGGPEQVKENCRGPRHALGGGSGAGFRYALRTMRQMPGFAAVAF
jgi:hypothetical protein